MASARIFTPATDGSFEDDVHDLYLDEKFIDENEAPSPVENQEL